MEQTNTTERPQRTEVMVHTAALPAIRGVAEIDIFDAGVSSSIMALSEIVSKSTIIPEHLKGKPSDCFVALYRAHRLGCDIFGFMEQTFVYKGKLGFQGQLIIAILNNSKKFKSDISFEYTEGEEIQTRVGKKSNTTCIAFGVLASTGLRVESPPVSLQMAIDNNWANAKDKDGNYMATAGQWFSLTRLRLAYRAATYLGRLYAPDATLGMVAVDELQDIQDGSYTDSDKPGKPLFPKVSEIAQVQGEPEKPAAETKPADPAIPLDKVVAPPAPTAEEKRAAFLEYFGAKDKYDSSIAFFTAKNWIKKGQTLSDISDENIDRAQKNPASFRSFFGSWLKTVKKQEAAITG